jgi:hypothetical protein
MEGKRFAIGDAVRFGWDTVKANPGYCIVVALILSLPGNILFVLERFILRRSSGFHTLLTIIDMIWVLFLALAVMQIGLRFTAGEKAGYKDLYAALPHLWHFFLGFLLYDLIITAGIFLLIIPGIIWAIKYQFFGYFIVDQGMTPRQALRRSGQVTKGAKSHLLLFDLTLFGVMLLGTLALVVGQLITAPINMMAAAWVYRRLLATEPGKAEIAQSHEDSETSGGGPTKIEGQR